MSTQPSLESTDGDGRPGAQRRQTEGDASCALEHTDREKVAAAEGEHIWRRASLPRQASFLRAAPERGGYEKLRSNNARTEFTKAPRPTYRPWQFTDTEPPTVNGFAGIFNSGMESTKQ